MAEVRELDPSDARALSDLYDEYEWFADRSREDVRAALRATELALGVEVESGEEGVGGARLVAAARVLTDYRFYGVVYDVVVAADRRGEGLGERLLRAVVEHPDLHSLPGLSLLCRRGLVPFYESVGFEEYDGAVELPDGTEEDLVRMTHEFDGDGDAGESGE